MISISYELYFAECESISGLTVCFEDQDDTIK